MGAGEGTLPAPYQTSASPQKHTNSEDANTKAERWAEQPSRLINAVFHDVLLSSICRLTRSQGTRFQKPSGWGHLRVGNWTKVQADGDETDKTINQAQG